MKTILQLLLLTLLIQRPSCQDKPSQFINEYSISGDYTLSENLGKLLEPGFGFGIFHVHHFTGDIALAVGLEYNMTRFSFDDGEWDKYKHEQDLTYTLNYLSVPITLRFSIGKEFKVFAEGGAFFENYLLTTSRGTVTNYGPPGSTEKSTSEFHELKLTNIINYGFIGCIGFQLPIGKYALIIKPGLTYGMKEIIVKDEDNEFYNRYAKISIAWKL
jgi:hypothetical protein